MLTKTKNKVLLTLITVVLFSASISSANPSAAEESLANPPDTDLTTLDKIKIVALAESRVIAAEKKLEGAETKLTDNVQVFEVGPGLMLTASVSAWLTGMMLRDSGWTLSVRKYQAYLERTTFYDNIPFSEQDRNFFETSIQEKVRAYTLSRRLKITGFVTSLLGFAGGAAFTAIYGKKIYVSASERDKLKTSLDELEKHLKEASDDLTSINAVEPTPEQVRVQ